MKFFRKMAVVAVVAAIICAGCKEDDPIPVSGISMEKDALIGIGKTLQLKIEITPFNATDNALIWESSNSEVATVSENGTVTASKLGKTTITVTANDGTASAACEVTVAGVMTIKCTEELFSAELVMAGTGTVHIDWDDEKVHEPGILSSTIPNFAYTGSYEGMVRRPRTITVTGDVSYLRMYLSKGIYSLAPLTSMDLSKNTALKELYCDEINLASLDVGNTTSLEVLSCNNNWALARLNVSGAPALKKLSCVEGVLTTLDISKNTALEVLNCRLNNMESLDVSKNTALRVLNCSGNSYVDDKGKLTSLDVSKNTALTELDCSGNRLTALHISKNTELTVLRCGNNPLNHPLKNIDVSNNTKLEELSCIRNQLTNLNLINNVALKTLILASNDISKFAMDVLFDTLHGNTIEGGKTIYISGNSGTGTCDKSIATARGWTVNTTTW
jgi:hypothetical protein